MWVYPVCCPDLSGFFHIRGLCFQPWFIGLLSLFGSFSTAALHCAVAFGLGSALNPVFRSRAGRDSGGFAPLYFTVPSAGHFWLGVNQKPRLTGLEQAVYLVALHRCTLLYHLLVTSG